MTRQMSGGVIVNLWFIRHSNGLFHYGLDYAEALGDAVGAIWVRDEALAAAVRKRLPQACVRQLTSRALFLALGRVATSSTLLFTPSSHPIAFVRRQVVIVHDSYPFTGRVGRVKLALFRTALAVSGATAGYINHADALAFLRQCGLPAGRTRFLPNRIGITGPRSKASSGQNAAGSDTTVIGLFGSDSPKKNYDALFAAALSAQPATRQVVWRIFGHANAYTERLQRDYPTLAIEVIESDRMTMEAFVDDLDVAVSIAAGEGFARPVALSLMRGVPTLLLNTPVFREFYADSAALFDTPEALVAAIPASLDDGLQPRFARADALRMDFANAVAWLRQQAFSEEVVS